MKRHYFIFILILKNKKISKSGVTGDTLEEAKKINLSLSALGNAIHALTTGLIFINIYINFTCIYYFIFNIILK